MDNDDSDDLDGLRPHPHGYDDKTAGAGSTAATGASTPAYGGSISTSRRLTSQAVTIPAAKPTSI